MIDLDPVRGLTAVRPLVPATAMAAPSWRLGAMVEALVLEDLRQGMASLRIGGTTYSAQIPFPVTKGERLLLEVASLAPLPTLRAVRDTGAADPVAPALRALLPQQGALGPALARLEALLTAAQGQAEIPPKALQAAEHLLQSLPTRGAVTNPEGLRTALANSGILLEAKLLATAPDGSNDTQLDFKANLLRLEQALGQSLGTPAKDPATSNATSNPTSAPKPGAEPLLPPLRAQHPAPQPRTVLSPPDTTQLGAFLVELDADIGSALARIQLHQLASQPLVEAREHFWLLELPVRQDGETDVWQLRIEEEPRRKHTPDVAAWRVEMAFDLPGLGPLVACLELRANQVSVRFWAEQTATATLLDENLNLLEDRLGRVGVTTGSLSCHHGKPRHTAPETPRDSLLNLTA